MSEHGNYLWNPLSPASLITAPGGCSMAMNKIELTPCCSGSAQLVFVQGMAPWLRGMATEKKSP